MTQEQLNEILVKLEGDRSLQEKLKAAVSPEDVMGIAKEYGHEFTVDKISQLSEGELEDVAGGHNTCGGGGHCHNTCGDPSRPTW